MGDDGPDVVIAKRLLDHAKLCGFEFHRIAPGEDGPLVGNRVSSSWVDIIHIKGFSHDCLALRQRASPLILPGQHGASQESIASATKKQMSLERLGDVIDSLREWNLF